MLNISGIQEGFVLDHIKAGMSMSIYKDLKLDHLDCQIAIIKNARSNKMGKKDILKAIIKIALGIIGLKYGSDFVVNNSSELALKFGVSEKIKNSNTRYYN